MARMSQMVKPKLNSTAKKGMTKKNQSKGKAVVTKKRQKARITRILKDKAPKLVENVKNLLILRGNKTTQHMNELLTDLRKLKLPESKLLSRKNDIHVFDDETQIEFLTQKNDTSCFVIGSSTKKRPNNLLFGRTFDGHILDIMELGVENLQTMSDIGAQVKKAPGSKPCFLFQGDVWSTSPTHQKLQNILMDTFRGPQVVSKIHLHGFDHVICCTAVGSRVLFRSYVVDFKKVDGEKNPRAELLPMGPHMDLTFRRSKFASVELMKMACKQPKGLVEKKQKNVTRDALTGDKVGRVYVENKDIYTMQAKRVKALRTTTRAHDVPEDVPDVTMAEEDD